MAGTVFVVGQQMVRPGVYFRVMNTGGPQTAAVPQGITAVLFRSSWGPLGTVQNLTDPTTIHDLFGSEGTVDAIEQAFAGGCMSVQALRMGSGGTAASITLKDTTPTTPVNVVQLNLAYVGLEGNNYSATVRDSLTDSTLRELIVYEDATIRQKFTFAKGATGSGEPQFLTDAVNTMALPWISATKLADGNKTMAAVSQSAFTGGVDPTVVVSDINTALNTIAPIDWNVLVTDSEDPSVHATIQSFVDNQRNYGKLVQATVGEPTSVTLATRQADAQAFNDFAVTYVLNGFELSDGTSIEGYKAAARVAGMISAMNITDSLTHAIVNGATDIVGPLQNSDIVTSLQAGAIVFTFNAKKQVQVEYGINTYITPDANHDAGWKKIRRVNTRDYLMSEVAATWDPLVGKVNNNPSGQATLIAAAQGVVNQMIKEGALLNGKVSLDTSNPAQGDSAWFVFSGDDVDSAEKLYMAFGFEFAPATA